ncbi:TetR family transcriptional regulator [Kitasatospora sp. MMS16-BH015]|uniref:TetR/AcrR family transcriptional regulator n=1 Tax=Kitasatospora sp. MMS16-BH015 TaxID=2018025 RepID=UPI000CA2085B|nr:TetR family transcriptional regulator [Kitasatospora sp. MMS16-BH015]AUG78348.1 TetR family transcriptional regulator [Kitasatospora sp. MMS16-BH015]
MGNEILGLRESKKLETRRLIAEQAVRLFVEQGFEQTTIAEVAEAARVAKKTVTNYFPRKEDLALDRHEAFVQSLAHAVLAREEGESMASALRRQFTTALEARDPVAGFSGAPFARMVTDSPTLTAGFRDLHDLREAALAAALADDTAAPNGHPGFADRTAAALGAAVARLLFDRVQELTLAGRSDDRIAETVAPEAARAFDLLAAALGSYPEPARR